LGPATINEMKHFINCVLHWIIFGCRWMNFWSCFQILFCWYFRQSVCFCVA